MSSALTAPKQKLSEIVTTVTDCVQNIKTILESHYPLLYVKGEICECTHAKSGHVYFTIKDTMSQLACTLFKQHSTIVYQREQLKVGISVIIKAQISLYAPRGQLHAQIMDLRIVGKGSLKEQYLALRRKCLAMGLSINANN